MARARLRLEWDQTSLLWATILEPHRDQEQRREPFNPAEVHPLHHHEQQPEENDEPDMAIWATITRSVPVHTIDLRKLNGGT